MCELEKAVEQLKAEGFTVEQIRGALDKMKESAHPVSRKSLDEYLDGITDENRHEEMITDSQGKEII